MHIIDFEWKKLYRSKVFIPFLLITILFIAGLFVRNYLYQDIVKEQKLDYFQEHASNVFSQLITHQEKQMEMGEGFDPSLNESIELGKSLYGKLQELVTSIEKDEHLTALEIENEAYEIVEDYRSLDNHYPLSQTEIEDEITLNKELLKQKLPKEDLTASIQPAVFMKHTVQLILQTFPFFILLMIIGTPVVKEFDDQTMKLTYTLPISSARMVLSKWASLVISGLIWIITVYLSAYVIASLFGKEGTNPFKYPFFTKEMTLMPATDYIQHSILFGLLYLFVLMSIFILLSFIVKNRLVVQIILLILFVGNYIIMKSGIVYSFLPWSYQEIDLSLLQQDTISWTGVILSLVLVIVLLLIAIKASKRREY